MKKSGVDASISESGHLSDEYYRSHDIAAKHKYFTECYDIVSWRVQACNIGSFIDMIPSISLKYVCRCDNLTGISAFSTKRAFDITIFLFIHLELQS